MVRLTHRNVKSDSYYDVDLNLVDILKMHEGVKDQDMCKF